MTELVMIKSRINIPHGSTLVLLPLYSILYRMGTSTRPPLYNYSNSVVGPGSYHQEPKDPKKFDKKTFAKGKRGQSELKGVTTVGPGSYNPKKFHKAYPQFSFGYKTDPFHTTDRALTPGPGQYDIHNPWDQFADTYIFIIITY